MSDQLVGSSWNNPIWRGKWRIYLSPDYNVHGYKFEYVHDDFDGAPDSLDNRYGYAASVDMAVQLIETWEEENLS